MRFLIYYIGSIVGLFSALPLPFRVRVWMALGMEKATGIFLGSFPQLYTFIYGENKRHKMGKQSDREMESIMALELVLCEIERRNISPSDVKILLSDAKKQQIIPADLPGFLGMKLLGIKDTRQMLHRIVAF